MTNTERTSKTISFLYEKKSLYNPPLVLTIFIGLILTVLIYTIIEQSHILDTYGKLIWYQPFFLILGLMVPIYKCIIFIRKIKFKCGINDPFLLRLLMKHSLQTIYTDINNKLNSLELTSADILTEILESKINHIYYSDCLRFPQIRRHLDQLKLGSSKRTTKFSKFFNSVEDYESILLPAEIRLLSDVVSRKRKDLQQQSKELQLRYCKLVTFLGNYLSLWPISRKKIETIVKKYQYRPPSKNQTLRITFALQTASYLYKFKNGKLNDSSLHNYEVMSNELIANFSIAAEKYKKAWEKMIIAYEANHK